MKTSSAVIMAIAVVTNAAYLPDKRALTTVTVTASSSESPVPDYFQTSTELFPGPTQTGLPPFLAQSNPVIFGGPQATFVPNTPLQVAETISGEGSQQNIFRLMGNLSPYFPNPTGFGVDEFPLPAGANISQVHMVSRHGSRYPTSNSSVEKFGVAIKNSTAMGNKFTGALSFLNNWSYILGAEILTPVGRNELYSSGVLHQYQYGGLYNPETKIVVRTTSQDRITKSAENFLAGFFGLGWGANATLVTIIEGNYFNDTLAGYDNCNNSNTYVSAGGTNATNAWVNIYLANATERFKPLVGNFNLTASEVYAMQTLCPYETNGLGYSEFCNLFTYDEWKDFEYSIDLGFAGGSMFQNPTGRAVGIGFVQEKLAILNQHYLTSADTQANVTLDSMPSTFPLNQTLYFDFSHDTNIASILTAFGLVQFAQFLPTTGAPANQQMIVSHMEPFGARLDIEIIKAPHPVSANRTSNTDAYTDTEGPATMYVHFILNQRTIPLGASFPACGNRTDGWCEAGAFLQVQAGGLAASQYEYACFGNYPAVPYGLLSDGAPQAS